MFDLLSRYLIETGKLTIPETGTFRLKAGEASTDAALSTIAAPSWHIELLPGDDGDDGSNERLHHWLAAAKAISKEDAAAALAGFGRDLKSRLMHGEVVAWPGMGTLRWENEQAVFTAKEQALSPFTDVTAQKVMREHTSYTTIVGGIETTTAQMREQLAPATETRRSRNTVMWILLCLAGVAAVWYFTQNGCNKTATGNRQNVEPSRSGDTYKLQ